MAAAFTAVLFIARRCRTCAPHRKGGLFAILGKAAQGDTQAGGPVLPCSSERGSGTEPLLGAVKQTRCERSQSDGSLRDAVSTKRPGAMRAERGRRRRPSVRPLLSLLRTRGVRETTEPQSPGPWPLKTRRILRRTVADKSGPRARAPRCPGPWSCARPGPPAPALSGDARRASSKHPGLHPTRGCAH